MVNADHPDYENVYGPDDFDPLPTGGDGVVFDSILGVPFLLTSIDLRDSTQPNAKEGDKWAIIGGRFLAPVARVQLNGDGGTRDFELGEEFSSKSGSYKVVALLKQMTPGGRMHSALGRVVVKAEKVPGDTSPGKKMRQLAVLDKADAAALLAKLSAE